MALLTRNPYPAASSQLGALALLLLASLPRPVCAEPVQDRIAVVIGISTYPEMPATLALPQIRRDARSFASALETQAGYTEVIEMLDGVATRTAIEDMLLKTLPSRVGAEDTVLIYFAGYGVGGDFDDPYLLPYDFKAADVQGTAIQVRGIAQRLSERLAPGALIVITDAVHDGTLNGISLIGPTAKHWPNAADNFFCLASTSPQERPTTSLFGTHLIEGLQGAADISKDGLISASEIHRYVLDRMMVDTQDQIHPSESGQHDPGLVVGRVQPGIATAMLPSPTTEPPPEGDDEAPSGNGLHVAGWSLLGASALLGGLDLYFYLDGRRFIPAIDADPSNDDEIPGGYTQEEISNIYNRDRTLNRWLPVGAIIMAATGGTLLFLPSGEGVMLGTTMVF